MQKQNVLDMEGSDFSCHIPSAHLFLRADVLLRQDYGFAKQTLSRLLLGFRGQDSSHWSQDHLLIHILSRWVIVIFVKATVSFVLPCFTLGDTGWRHLTHKISTVAASCVCFRLVLQQVQTEWSNTHGSQTPYKCVCAHIPWPGVDSAINELRLDTVALVLLSSSLRPLPLLSLVSLYGNSLCCTSTIWIPKKRQTLRLKHCDSL